MFADDTQLLNKNEESVEQSFLILSKFEKASGSKINYEKTKGLFIAYVSFYLVWFIVPKKFPNQIIHLFFYISLVSPSFQFQIPFELTENF
jgi:hypothetical protein